MKTFSKYFSIVLVLLLIQSNFSFAITQILCKMEKMQNSCECENPCEHELQINSEESNCCKVTSGEINNTNILEFNKLSIIKDIKFQLIDNFLTVNLLTHLSQNFRSNILHFKPPADIPIVFSHILI